MTINRRRRTRRRRASPDFSLIRISLLALALCAGAKAYGAGHWTEACKHRPPQGLAAPEPRTTLVLIIDDLGYQWRNGLAVVELPGKINLAVLPHTPHARRIAHAGFDASKEIMLHAPMSNEGGMSLGAGGLTAEMSRGEFDQALAQALDAVPHVRGVNNHMGSELTQLPMQMGWLMQALLRRDLYFVDSRTSAATVAAETATSYHVPNLSRAVFLDNERKPEAIAAQFDRLVRLAEQDGVAVGIGHPYPETSRFLRRAIPGLRCRGIDLAYASEVLGSPPTSEPDFYAPLRHVGLGLGHGIFPEVKDAGGQYRVGTTKQNAVDQVIQGAHSP